MAVGARTAKREEAGAALVLGRFQPPHNGHLHLLARALTERHRLVIVVGSAEKSGTFENPFTLDERIAMLGELVPAGRAEIAAVADLGRYARWVEHVVARVPPFDLVVTGSAVTRVLFEEAGFPVRFVPLVDRAGLQGSSIRRLIASGGAWEPLVPAPVARQIRALGGVERLAGLASAETATRGGRAP